MDTGKDAGPSGLKESPTGHTVIDAAGEYEPQNAGGTQEQSAGPCAPDESVTGDEPVNSAERSQLADATRPDAADEGIKRQSPRPSNGISEDSLENIAGAPSNDIEAVNQTARPGESDPAHQDDPDAQGDEGRCDASGGAGAGLSSGLAGDSVIDIDGSQGSQSASVSHPWGSIAEDEVIPYKTTQEQQAYWYRLKSAVGDADWEKYFNPSEAPLGDETECVCAYCDKEGLYPEGWRVYSESTQISKSPKAFLGFNIGLVSILHLGAMYDIDPEFFRDDTMNRFREGPVISSSASGIWCHFSFRYSEPFLYSTEPLHHLPNDDTSLSVYWSTGARHPRPVLALIRNSKVVEIEELKGPNFIQRREWKSHREVLSTAFESQEAATRFSTRALRRPSLPRNREVEDYLLDPSTTSEIYPYMLFPMDGQPLRIARFIMDWLSGLFQDGVPPSISHGDVALLQRFPTQASLDMLCCSMNVEVWQYTTALLEQEATRLARRALVEPTFTTFRSLNHCRKLVNRLISIDERSKSQLTLERLCDRRKILVGTCDNRVDMQTNELTPAKDFDNEARLIREKLAAVDSRLKETFTLLVQAVTVIDSDANRKAATQASLLTLLAALYLPATLATSIFGMNIKLFTDDSNAADWRVVIYTFMVVLAPSLAFITFVFLPNRDEQSIRGSFRSRMVWYRQELRHLYEIPLLGKPNPL